MTDEFHHGHHSIDVEGRAIAKDAARQSESNDSRLDALELKIKNISLLNEALYEILVVKLNISENELSAMVDQVVLNRIDRVGAKSNCRICGRLVPSNRKKCLYCGGELSGDVKTSLFDR